MDAKKKYTPRAMTHNQLREKFLKHVWEMIRYWNEVPDLKQQDRIDGIAFSILTMIDGESADFPAFILAPNPHPDDKASRIRRGEKYYSENDASKIKCDIAGELHDMFYHYKPKE